MADPADLVALKAVRAELVAARLTVLKGERVKEVWRDGRRLIFAEASAAVIKDAIADIDAEILAMEDELNGTTRSRRRSIGVVWGG